MTCPHGNIDRNCPDCFLDPAPARAPTRPGWRPLGEIAIRCGKVAVRIVSESEVAIPGAVSYILRASETRMRVDIEGDFQPVDMNDPRRLAEVIFLLTHGIKRDADAAQERQRTMLGQRDLIAHQQNEIAQLKAQLAAKEEECTHWKAKAEKHRQDHTDSVREHAETVWQQDVIEKERDDLRARLDRAKELLEDFDSHTPFAGESLRIATRSFLAAEQQQQQEGG